MSLLGGEKYRIGRLATERRYEEALVACERTLRRLRPPESGRFWERVWGLFQVDSPLEYIELNQRRAELLQALERDSEALDAHDAAIRAAHLVLTGERRQATRVARGGAAARLVHELERKAWLLRDVGRVKEGWNTLLRGLMLAETLRVDPELHGAVAASVGRYVSRLCPRHGVELTGASLRANEGMQRALRRLSPGGAHAQALRQMLAA